MEKTWVKLDPNEDLQAANDLRLQSATVLSRWSHAVELGRSEGGIGL